MNKMYHFTLSIVSDNYVKHNQYTGLLVPQFGKVFFQEKWYLLYQGHTIQWKPENIIIVTLC